MWFSIDSLNLLSIKCVYFRNHRTYGHHPIPVFSAFFFLSELEVWPCLTPVACQVSCSIFRDLLSFEKAPGSCSSCTEGRNVIRKSVSKRMSCDVDPFQRPALTKPVAGNEVSPCCWAVASFLKDSPVSWQSVSWALSGKWRLEVPYIQLQIYHSTRQLLKEIYLEGTSFTLLLSRRQTKCQKKFCFFLLNLVVQTWKVNKKLAINNMKSFLTRKESRAALIN